MTTITTMRSGMEKNGVSKLMMCVGEHHYGILRYLLQSHNNPLVAFYHFAVLFEASSNFIPRESGVHLFIDQIDIDEPINWGFEGKTKVYPIAATLKRGFTLDNYDRLRESRRGGNDRTSFPAYQKLEGG